jgi:hypothetical protein
MSETITNQEQPETIISNQESVADGNGNTTGETEQPDSNQEPTPTVTLIPPLAYERTPEEVEAGAEVDPLPQAPVPEAKPEAAETVVEEAPEATVAQTQETEVETVAEVGVAKEAPSQSETSPVKIGVAGSLALGAAVLATKVFRRKSKPN